MGEVYLDGAFVAREAARIPVDDRGFIFGDGVYEVWRVVGGSLFEPGAHLERLHRGLDALGIARPPEAELDRLHAIARRLFHGAGLLDEGREGTLYLEITRGAAPRTHYFPPAATRPTVFLAANPFTPSYADDPSRPRPVAAITAPDVRWLRCDLKTIQLLPNVMARQAAAAAGAAEAVLVRDGVITEGTHTSVFGVVDGVLRTHPLDCHVLPGVTRAVVLQLARALGIPTREDAMPIDVVPALDELMLVGTTTDVTPITVLDGRAVGGGAAGPVAAALFRGLRARLDAAAAPVTPRPESGG